MAPIYTATNGMHEAIRQQAEMEGWSLKYEYDDVVWFRFECPKLNSDDEHKVIVDVWRNGKITVDGDKTLLSQDLMSMLRAFACLMVPFWAQYAREQANR